METRSGRIFGPYFAMSAMCTLICLYHLWQDPNWKSRSFLDRIKLSRIGTAILGNMAFASLLLLYKGILYVFFGTITMAETQKMWQRLVNYMVFNLLAVSAILDPRLDVVLKWGGWLFLMASMRLLCDLARNRFKVLITYTPNAAWWIHGKIVTLLGLLMFIDVAVFAWAMHVRDEFTKDQLFLVVSECFSLSVVAMGALIKYLIYYIDMSRFEGQWEHRGSYSYYTDLFSKSIILMVSLIYYATILHLHGVSMNIFFDILIIIRLVVILVSLRTKFIAYQNYRQLSNQIANMYKPLDADEIAEYNDNCAICRDPMDSALRLPCGHIFHTTCLRSWLEHNHNCPTCRYALIAQQHQAAPAQQHRPAPVPRPASAQRQADPTNLNNVNLSQETHPDMTQQLGLRTNSTTLVHTAPTISPDAISSPVHSRQDASQRISTTSGSSARTRNEPTAESSTNRSSTPPRASSQGEQIQRPRTPQSQRRTVTSATEATTRHEQMQAAEPQSVWSFSSPSWLAWLPSLSVEVVRGQDPGIGHMDQKDLTVHRENLEQVRALFPDIPESVALADLLATRDLQETINNIIENRLSWSPGSSGPTAGSSSGNSASPTPQPLLPLPPLNSATPSSSSRTPSFTHAPSAQIPKPTSPSTRSRLVQSSPNPTVKPVSKPTPPPTVASYQERKAAMIESARAAYLKKMANLASTSNSSSAPSAP